MATSTIRSSRLGRNSCSGGSSVRMTTGNPSIAWNRPAKSLRWNQPCVFLRHLRLNALTYFVALENQARTWNDPECHAAVINRSRLSQPGPVFTGTLSTAADIMRINFHEVRCKNCGQSFPSNLDKEKPRIDRGSIWRIPCASMPENLGPTWVQNAHFHRLFQCFSSAKSIDFITT